MISRRARLAPGRMEQSVAGRLRAPACALLTVILVGCDNAGSGRLPQSIGVPAYFDSRPLWSRMAAARPTVAMAVLNPASGVGVAPVSGLADTVRETRAVGVKVIGYVHTSYGRRASGDVLSEVARYKDWYGVDGIFFDEVSASCADQPYYGALSAHVRAWGAGTTTVLNPGRQTLECFMSVADVIITFEGSYEAYLSEPESPGWTQRYSPDRFWHLVYDAPTARRMREVIRASKSRGAGWVYVTPEALPNPWGTLPSDAYWSNEVKVAADPRRR